MPTSSRSRITAVFGTALHGRLWRRIHRADTVLAGPAAAWSILASSGVPGQSQVRLIFSLIPDTPKSPRYTQENEVCVFKFAIRGDASEELLGRGVFQC